MKPSKTIHCKSGNIVNLFFPMDGKLEEQQAWRNYSWVSPRERPPETFAAGGQFLLNSDAPTTYTSTDLLTVEDIAEIFDVNQDVDYDKLAVPIDYPYDIKRYDYYKMVHPLNKSETNCPVDPKLYDWLMDHDLEPFVSQLFYTGPNNSLKVHCDTFGVGNHAKINFTWGHEDSRTTWFKLKEGKPYKLTSGYMTDDTSLFSHTKDTPSSIPLITANPDDIELVKSHKMEGLTIVNVGVLHATDNPTPQGRWTMSVNVKIKGINKPPTVEDIAERLPLAI